MIMTPDQPSDKTPQVKVTTPDGRATMIFWQERGTQIDPDMLADILIALPKKQSWRAHARRGRHGSGSNFGGCHVAISMPGQGCTEADFNRAFDQFQKQVMLVVNR